MWSTPGCRLMGSLSLIPLSDSPGLRFLLMSASLVSFFFFFFFFFLPLSRLSLSFHLSSLSWKKEKSTLPVFHSRCLIFCLFFFAFFFPSFLTHPHTIFSTGKQQPIQPVACSGLWGCWVINHMIRWVLLQTWLSGSRRRNLYRGR